MSRRRVPERYSLSYGNSIFVIRSQAVAFNIMKLSGSEHRCAVEGAPDALKSLMFTGFVSLK
jgi:hypothetical protein